MLQCEIAFFKLLICKCCYCHTNMLYLINSDFVCSFRFFLSILFLLIENLWIWHSSFCRCLGDDQFWKHGIGWNIQVFHLTTAELLLKTKNNYLNFVFAGIQKSLRSDFDMAYERGRISVSAEDGNTPPTFSRVSTLWTLQTNQITLTLMITWHKIG